MKLVVSMVEMPITIFTKFVLVGFANIMKK